MNTGNYEEWLEWRKKYFKGKSIMGRDRAKPKREKKKPKKDRPKKVKKPKKKKRKGK